MITDYSLKDLSYFIYHFLFLAFDLNVSQSVVSLYLTAELMFMTDIYELLKLYIDKICARVCEYIRPASDFSSLWFPFDTSIENSMNLYHRCRQGLLHSYWYRTYHKMSASSKKVFEMPMLDSFDSLSFPYRQMVDHLDQDQLQSYKEAFVSFDSNHNGKVSSSNLKVILVFNSYTKYISVH